MLMKSEQLQAIIPESRQSAIGRISLVLSVLSTLMVIGIFPLMSFLDNNKIEVPEPWQSVGALYMPLAALFALVAVVTGIAGLFVKNRRRGFALAGLIVGGCSILLFAGIIVMTAVFMARNST